MQLDAFEVLDDERIIGMAQDRGQQLRFAVSRRDGEITRIDRLVGDSWVTDRDNEPPFSPRMLVKARLRGDVC